MLSYEISITVFGKLYEMSFDLIMDLLREKYGLEITDDGGLFVSVNHRSELRKIANEIEGICFAVRPSIVAINFYGEIDEAFAIAVQPSIGEGDAG